MFTGDLRHSALLGIIAGFLRDIVPHSYASYCILAIATDAKQLIKTKSYTLMRELIIPWSKVQILEGPL